MTVPEVMMLHHARGGRFVFGTDRRLKIGEVEYPSSNGETLGHPFQA